MIYIYIYIAKFSEFFVLSKKFTLSIVMYLQCRGVSVIQKIHERIEFYINCKLFRRIYLIEPSVFERSRDSTIDLNVTTQIERPMV